jgi:hypothetical protein
MPVSQQKSDTVPPAGGFSRLRAFARRRASHLAHVSTQSRSRDRGPSRSAVNRGQSRPDGLLSRSTNNRLAAAGRVDRRVRQVGEKGHEPGAHVVGRGRGPLGLSGPIGSHPSLSRLHGRRRLCRCQIQFRLGGIRLPPRPSLLQLGRYRRAMTGRKKPARPALTFDDLPLFATDRDIAEAVVGPDEADMRAW